ncbi:MAG: hypothetical protein LBD65_00600 [Spirochaetaceae bacterium]|jgi:hypothetical protein|nr:hypothetical protein [Spirochaetaceae bacterium]
MKGKLFFFAGILFCGILLAPLGAEDDFGFGFADEGAAAAPVSSPVSGVRIGGKIRAELLAYVDDSNFKGSFENTLGNIFSGQLEFSASGENADGVINLRLKPVFDGTSSPIEIDEAYARAYFGSFSIEGGLRKLTWGKADSLGPLDVVNPLDYRDLTSITDIQGMKIALPMVHLSYGIGDFSKLEAVFIPWFQGHRFDETGHWIPAEANELPALLTQGVSRWLYDSRPPGISQAQLDGVTAGLSSSPLGVNYPDTHSMDYAQGGLRFTTTWLSADLGFQYYFGRLPRPAVSLAGLKTFWQQYATGVPPVVTPSVVYNPYHQIGVDSAMVLGGFNLRAEFAAHITEDLSGEDGAVYNPFLAWSLGFDRDLLWGINVNLQVNETVRLLDGGVMDNPALDTEAGKAITSTRFTGVLSKKFFRDELELRTAVIWGIEDQDVYVLPGIFWTRGDVGLEFSGGVFAGNKQGELGQYHENNFVKLGLTYTF